ncbi:cilia- and flagella-associated protein 263 isoform X3 [Heliangelus exortis]|uniref:cilia- and flagella-associated protein 263 isoform X3 n=1 Tax=Heliangelus exortis TaxID=472823 RepID=UPI003A8E39E0
MAERSPRAVPLPQLRSQLQEARQANTLLQMEVEMFEKCYHKMESCGPSLLHQSEMSAPPEPTQTRGRYKSKFHGATDCLVGLTVEQKYELAQRELTEMENDIQSMKEDSEQTMEKLKAVTEEADAWWTDVKKAISDFENITSTISCKRGSVIASEKLLRYMEEKNCQRDLLREKLLLKNFLLKGYKKKLLQQLRQRKLRDAMETSTSLLKNISQRKELLEKIEREAALVEEQQAEVESVNCQLQKQLSDYSVPPVLSYVQKKMDVTDLESSLKAWARKVAVAEMSLQSYRRAWNQVRMYDNHY